MIPVVFGKESILDSAPLYDETTAGFLVRRVFCRNSRKQNRSPASKEAQCTFRLPSRKETE